MLMLVFPPRSCYVCSFARSWQVAQSGLVPPSRSYHTTTIIENKLYVFGGTDSKQRRFDDLSILDTEVEKVWN